jgi:hypothetical protein
LDSARAELDLKYPMVALRTDPDLADHWELMCSVTGEAKNVPLTQDYLRLLATVFPEAASGDNLARKVENLRFRLGLSKPVQPRYKVFRRQDDGLLLNMADDERNVSFKVQTFCGMLDDLHRNFVDAVKLNRGSDALVIPEVESRFTEAGHITGARFGKALVDLWSRSSSPDDLEGVLDYWCNFDSDVGFGSLAARLTDKAGRLGSVTVEQNFLAAGRGAGPQQANLCQLLVGYIGGVLTHVLGSPIIVEHKHDACMRLVRGRTSCEFQFGPRL